MDWSSCLIIFTIDYSLYAGQIGILVRSFKQLWIKRSLPSYLSSEWWMLQWVVSKCSIAQKLKDKKKSCYLSCRVANVAISTVVRECSIAQKLNHQQPLLQWMRWKLFCSCDAKDVHKIIFGIKWQTIIIVLLKPELNEVRQSFFLYWKYDGQSS